MKKANWVAALVWMLMPAAVFAAPGDVTVRDAAGVSKPAVAGEEIVTHDDALSQLEVEGTARAVTVPCPTCHTTITGVKASSKEGTALAIRHGGIAIDVDPRRVGQTFELDSPVAVAAVRGTRFAGIVHHDGSETYVVERGMVEVSVQGAPIGRITPGQAFDVAADGGAKEVREARPDELSVVDTLDR